MNFSYDELNPAEPCLEINGQEIELFNLRLKETVLLEKQFGSIKTIFDVIRKEPLTLYKVLWVFVKDKARFNYSYKNFYNNLNSGNILEVSKKSFEILNSLIYNSMPLIKNVKRYQEIQKIRKAQNEDASPETCYGKFYDKMAARYNYTIQEFYELTLRQIHILLAKLEDGQYKEIEVQAALLGKEMKPRINYADFSEEEEAEQDAEAQSLFDRLKKQYEENKNKEVN